MKKTCVCLIMVFVFAIFFNLNFVWAFGVSTIYSENFPLRMQQGQVKETFFLLSNVVEGDSDVIIDSQLALGKEIVSLINENNRYTVQFGAEVEVPVRIEIPKDAAPGTRYRVGMIFKPIPLEAQGANIQFLVNIGKSFPVIVIGGNEKSDDISASEKDFFTLTLEEQPEQIVRDLSPQSRSGTGVLIGIIFVLIVGIMTAIVIIIYLLVKRRRVESQMMGAGFVQGQGEVFGSRYLPQGSPSS